MDAIPHRIAGNSKLLEPIIKKAFDCAARVAGRDRLFDPHDRRRSVLPDPKRPRILKTTIRSRKVEPNVLDSRRKPGKVEKAGFANVTTQKTVTGSVAEQM